VKATRDRRAVVRKRCSRGDCAIPCCVRSRRDETGGNMTDEELREYSREHLEYEVSRLYRTADRLMTDAPSTTMGSRWKSSSNRLRCMRERSRRSCTRQERVMTMSRPTCTVKDPTAWQNARGTIPPILKDAVFRTGKEILHLTTLRKPAGAPDKAWSIESLVRAFDAPLNLFVDHVAPGRLDPTVVDLVRCARPGGKRRRLQALRGASRLVR